MVRPSEQLTSKEVTSARRLVSDDGLGSALGVLGDEPDGVDHTREPETDGEDQVNPEVAGAVSVEVHSQWGDEDRNNDLNTSVGVSVSHFE